MLADAAFRRFDRSVATREAWWAPSATWEDPLWRTVAILGVTSLLVPVLVIALLAVSLLSLPLSGSLPAPRPSLDSRISRVYDATGGEIANFHRYDTSLPVARGDIPRSLTDAVVAAEDRRFYEHNGVDSRGILRALTADLQGGGYVEGASTITQQYVRLVYTGDERTIGRKLREAVLAGRVEQRMSKDEILYQYLSRAYFGSGAYGVGAAADAYFGKPARDLSLSESAMLAGLLSAPSLYDPRVSPGDAEYQRQRVLGKMADQGRISQQDLAETLPQRVVLADNHPPAGTPATIVQPIKAVDTRYPWFSDYVRGYLVARYGDDMVYQGGLRVETSLDPVLQAKADAAVTEALKGTQAPLDMALASVDPQTGLVKALVGGRDFTRSQVNLSLGSCPSRSGPAPDDQPVCVAGGGTGRQPGSSFKPFTLAKAFEQGSTAEKGYPGPGTYTIPFCKGVGCTIHNVESGGYGYLNLRQATAYSVNTVFAQLIQDVGIKDTAEMAHRLGLTSVDPGGKLPNGDTYGPSLTLGVAEVSPLDMAAAYGVFAARGVQRPVSPVVRVLGNDGRVLEDNRARAGKRVLEANVADEVSDVLKDVVGYGTGKAADIGRPNGTAGKTGTAENYSDAWFVGYTPQLSTSVWMGYSDSQKPLVGIKGLSQVYGGTIPAKTWHDFMSKALDGVPAKDFTAPTKPLPAAPLYTPGPSPPVTTPSVTEPPVPYATDPGYGYGPPATAPPAPLPPAADPTVPFSPPAYVPSPRPPPVVVPRPIVPGAVR